MRAYLLTLLALLILSSAGFASTTPAFLSDTEIRLTSTFRGLELDIVGYAAADTAGRQPDVLIYIYGPSEDYVLRRKRRFLGLWVNAEIAQVPDIPSYQWVLYTAGASRRLSDFETLSRYRFGDALDALPDDEWRRGLEEDLMRSGHYGVEQGGVFFRDGGLYDGSAFLLSTLQPGSYQVSITLAYQDGTRQTRALAVELRHDNLTAWLIRLGSEQPLLYALLAILMALVTGYGAALAFRR